MTHTLRARGRARLLLVDQLADSWGYALDQVGTTVWFRLTG